jgi:uncharacterized membrane protein (TIGR02234 family)
VLGAILLGAGLVAFAAGRPWVGQPVSGVPGVTRVTVSGGAAQPALTALALVLAAGAVALALIGRVASRIVAGLLILAGLGVIALVATVLQNPAEALAPALEQATGQTMTGQAGVVTGRSPESTGWPWAAVGGAVLTLSGAFAGLAAGGRWGGSRRRFEGASASSEPAGSEAGTASPGTDAGVISGRQAGRARAGRERSLDDWDALSRGEDPTAG